MSGWSIYIEVSQIIISKNPRIYLKIDFVLANSADPDEMPHHAAFHLGLHCSPKYLFRCFLPTKGYYREVAFLLLKEYFALSCRNWQEDSPYRLDLTKLRTEMQ